MNDALLELMMENPTWTMSEVFPHMVKMFPEATHSQIKNKMKRIRTKIKTIRPGSTSESVLGHQTSATASNFEGRDSGLHEDRLNNGIEDYISDAVQIQEISSQKGQGVIATRNIAQGEILVKEKPLLGCSLPRVQRNALCAAHFDKQFETLSSQDKDKIMSLHDCGHEQKTVVGIYLTNAVSRGPNGTTSCGILCPIVSRFNHSCSPNAAFNWREHEGFEVVVACRDIDCGEEVHVHYTELLETSGTRQVSLAERYGFKCACDVCSQDAKGLMISNRNRVRMKIMDDQIPMDGAHGDYEGALAKVKELLALAVKEEIGFLEGRLACDAFQLSTFAGRPTEQRIMWCQRTIDAWTVSHGEHDPDVLKYKAYLKKLPTPHAMMMQDMQDGKL